MVINKTVIVIAAIAVLVAIVVDKELAPADHVTLFAMFGTGTVLAAVAEWRLPAKWKPRVWWVFPLWILGLAAVGILMIEHVDPIAGGAVIGLATIAYALRLREQAKGPGGRWVVIMVGTALVLGAELGIEELAGTTGAWWGMAIRGVLIVVFLYATVQLLLAQHRARVAAGGG
ncbi:MAG TPA: hypothetical protein VIV11_18415 [Kofleriaceae bacterium]